MSATVVAIDAGSYGAMTRMKLGRQEPNGISASMYGLVDRGLTRRPRVAKTIRGTVEFRFEEAFAPSG